MATTALLESTIDNYKGRFGIGKLYVYDQLQLTVTHTLESSLAISH